MEVGSALRHCRRFSSQIQSLAKSKVLNLRRNQAKVLREQGVRSLCSASTPGADSAPPAPPPPAASTPTSPPTLGTPSIDQPTVLYGSPGNKITLDNRYMYMFDTHTMIRSFQTSGFSEVQAEQMTHVLCELVNVMTKKNNFDFVTKNQQEIERQKIQRELDSVKEDIVILKKSDFAALLNELEKRKLESAKLQETVIETLDKLESRVKLDMSLERSRSKDEQAVIQRELTAIVNKLESDKVTLTNSIQTSEMNSKILLAERLEVKFKTQVGIFITVIGVALTAAWRLMAK